VQVGRRCRVSEEGVRGVVGRLNGVKRDTVHRLAAPEGNGQQGVYPTGVGHLGVACEPTSVVVKKIWGSLRRTLSFLPQIGGKSGKDTMNC